ncbi:MAG: 16S rRNA (adenine(1518)-N(6)/adenine(1519)-N(6))-dimethyltransferase RsmA [Candidatus Paceibacterota bacterium]
MLPKKSLGQNFLISPYPVSDIIKTSNIKKGDVVLEIGPGKGILTSSLLLAGAVVFCVEKDRELIPFLKEKFKKEIKQKRLNILEGDILLFDIEKTLKEDYKLIANIPYYITGQIIRKFLETKNKPKDIVLLVQKEVAERIVAKDKKESLLSISVKFYGKPFYIRTVSKGSFLPKPKVDSAILHIKDIDSSKSKDLDSEKFFEILHLGFAHKRKQLLPNLARVFSKEKALQAFSEINLNPKTRPENLLLEDWINLSRKLV